MTICATNPCGCGIKSSSLIISGNGNQGAPWQIETNAFQVVTSSTRPSTPSLGVSIFETDTQRYLTWDGTYWVIMGGAYPEVSLTQRPTPADAPTPVGDATLTAAVFPQEVVDSDGFHVGTTNVVTVPAGLGGDFQFSMAATFAANAAGYRLMQAAIGSNTSVPLEIDIVRAFTPPTIATTNNAVGVSDSLRLQAGATLTIIYFQTSGGSLDVTRATARLRMTRHIPSLV